MSDLGELALLIILSFFGWGIYRMLDKIATKLEMIWRRMESQDDQR